MTHKRNHSPLEGGLRKAARYLWTENAVALAIVGGVMIAMSWIRTRYPWAEVRSHVMAFVVIFSRVVEKLASHMLKEGTEHPSETEPDHRPATRPRASPKPAIRNPKSAAPGKGRSGKPKPKKKGNGKSQRRKSGR